MGGAVRTEEVFEAVKAARDLAHLACHLADVAARMTERHQDANAARAGLTAREASIRAAESAFSLDQASEPELDEPAQLWLALDAVAVAQDAIDLAREALESIAPAPQPRTRAPSAQRALPAEAALGATLERAECIELYRRQVAVAWADGHVEPSERILLDGLRRTLGLSEQDALVVERDALTSRE